MSFDDVFKSNKPKEFLVIMKTISRDDLIDLWSKFGYLINDVKFCMSKEGTITFKNLDKINAAQKLAKDKYSLDSRSYYTLRQIVRRQLEDVGAKALMDYALRVLEPLIPIFPFVSDMKDFGIGADTYDLRKSNIYEPIVNYYKSIQDFIKTLFGFKNA